MGADSTNKRGTMPLNIDRESFWRFSLDIYADPSFREASLSLQDKYGVNVNIILSALKLASEGLSWDARDCELLNESLAIWSANTQQAVRAIRRRVGVLRSKYSCHDWYDAIKSMELSAERVEQALIVARLNQSILTRRRQEPLEMAAKNLRIYCRVLALSEVRHIDTLLNVFKEWTERGSANETGL